MNSFDKIIGYMSIKDELVQICDMMLNPAEYNKLGVTLPRGLLLYGKPGVGKTLMANTLIEASGRKAILCRKDQPNGEFIKKIKGIFEEAKNSAPCIIFLDDMDKFANEDDEHKNAEEYVTIQSGIDEVNGYDVFILATANDLYNIPDSLLRLGRFDRKFEISKPRGKDSLEIIEHFLKSKKFVDNIDSKELAILLGEKSCAELETVINEAGMYAGFERKSTITMEHIIKAYLRIFYDAPDAIHSCNDEISNETIYHEAGHTVVFEILLPGSVTIASVRYYNGDSRGFVSCYQGDCTYPQIRKNQIEIMGTLGGKAETELKFGIPDLGSEQDLLSSFSLVQSLIEDNCAAGFDKYGYGRFDSDLLKARQEVAVATEMERYYIKTKELLANNQSFVEKIAQALSEKEVLTGKDIQKIKSECDIISVSI